MTAIRDEKTAGLPPLPHWETTPPDLKAAITEIKHALRARIAGSGRSVEQVIEVVERRIAERVDEIDGIDSAGRPCGR